MRQSRALEWSLIALAVLLVSAYVVRALPVPAAAAA